MSVAWTTPCADPRLLQQNGLVVAPWNLDECVHCVFCGMCAAHFCYRDDANTILHLDHFLRFAQYGEPECGHIGGPAHLVPARYEPTACQLTAGHDGKHKARKGWSWPAT
ncbi:hypothetical protein [Streptomyces microflavus]|uniref:hypothetical protein n=1 Tax=Streptomyces microflavus TaxID=1919 RepID=UPI003B213638